MSWSMTLMGYLARRFFGAVFIVFAAFAALALSLDLADMFGRTTERGIPPDVVISMSLLKLPDLSEKLLPFAVLLGAIFAFSRMSRNHELVATRAAGVSAWQFITPSLFVAIGLGILTMTVFNPMASAFLAQYAKLEARYSDFTAGRAVTSGRSMGRSIEVSTIFGSGGGGSRATTSAARLPMSSSRGINPVRRVTSRSSVWKKRSRNNASFIQPTVMQ